MQYPVVPRGRLQGHDQYFVAEPDHGHDMVLGLTEVPDCAKLITHPACISACSAAVHHIVYKVSGPGTVPHGAALVLSATPGVHIHLITFMKYLCLNFSMLYLAADHLAISVCNNIGNRLLMIVNHSRPCRTTPACVCTFIL